MSVTIISRQVRYTIVCHPNKLTGSEIEETFLIYGRHNSVNATPSIIDTKTRSDVSPRICQSKFPRLLPITLRTPISFERFTACTVDKFTKFMQAMIKIKIAISESVQSVDLFVT